MNKLDKIMYISLPEHFQAATKGFNLDSSILLPIESNQNEINETLKKLSWELIIAAILKILAYNPNHKDIEYYKKLTVAIKPDIMVELTQGAFIKASQKNYELAEEILTALQQLFTSSAICQLNLTLILDERSSIYRQNKNSPLHIEYQKKAYDNYTTLFTMKNIPIDAYYHGGLFFCRYENHEQGLKILEYFIKNGTDKKQLKNAKNLVSTIKSEIKMSSNFKDAYALISENREIEAIEIIKLFLKDNDNVWNGWFLLGWAYRRIKNYKKAKQAFNKALSYEEKQVDIYNELSICNIELELFSESRINLQKAIKLEPFNIKILSNFGILELKEEKPEKALEWFNKVLEIDNKDEIALSYIELLIK